MDNSKSQDTRSCTARLREFPRACREAWRNNFITRIIKACGLKFVIVTFIIYGLDQGVVRSLLELGRVYFFKDRGLSPAEAQRGIAWSDMSWNIKPIIAITMDTMPIYGLHYRPYIAVFGSLGAIGYALVAATAKNASLLSDGACVAMLAFGLNGMIFKDVCIDGSTLRKMKKHPEIDMELPTLQNADLASVSIVFSLLSGFLIEWIGVSGVFIIIASIAAFSTLTSMLIEERRDFEKGKSHVCIPSPKAFFDQFKYVLSAFRNKVYTKLFFYCAIMQFSVDLSPAMVYWFDDVAHYSKAFQGSISTISWTISLVMIVVTGTLLKSFRYRTLFLIFQLIQATISSLDILLVSVAKDQFWGHFIALSDKAGTQGVTITKISVVFAAVADHVPDEGETTAMSFLLMMTNFPEFFFAPIIGSWVLDGLNIDRGNYDNLPWAILIRTLVRLLPIAFIPFLVPTGSSADKVRFDADDLARDGNAHQDFEDGYPQKSLTANGDTEAGLAKSTNLFSSKLLLKESELSQITRTKPSESESEDDLSGKSESRVQ